MTVLYDVVVKKRHIEGGNIAVMEFESGTSQCLPKFEAGAHIDLHLPNGMVRQYSLCQDPKHSDIFRLGVLSDPKSRGGSKCAFDDIALGQHLKISEPRNLFALHPAKHSILLGGGIGITPLITMAYQLLHQGASFELHYCGSHPEHCAFVNELKTGALAQHTKFHFKSEGANHRVYFQSALADLQLDEIQDLHIYTCGPQGFMDWIIDLAQSKGVHSDNIHKEYFQVELEQGGTAFEVFAQRSNKVIQVTAEQTILQALAEQGIEIEMSCEQGVCGTCMCDVLEGEPDHRDVYFTDEEKAMNEQILVCCSRAKSSRLVLDI